MTKIKFSWIFKDSVEYGQQIQQSFNIMCQMEPKTQQYYKPIPKSHLFLNKLKRISQIDRQIRKKWANLQKKNRQIDIKKMQSVMELQQIRQMQNQILQEPATSQKLKVLRVSHLKQELKRQDAFLRRQNLQEAYFKKKQKTVKIHLSPPSKSPIRKRIICSQKRMKTQGWESPQKQIKTPLMLQKRSIKFDKRLDIINKKYNQNLANIDKKQYLKEFRQMDSQKTMINKLKGTKIYYRLVSSFSTNQNSLIQ